MGITIDANTYLLCSLFNISYKKITHQYSGMTVEEIMEAEAEQGNTAAANFDKTVLNDPIKLIELFQLKDPGNKFAILRNMNEHDLEELLPLLEQADLIMGLNFFTKDKLLVLMEDLPKEQLVKFTLEMFSPEHLMQLMPEYHMNRVLMSTEMKENKGLELKCLESINPEILAQMIEAATGQEAAGVGEPGLNGKPVFDKKAMLEQLATLPDDKFQDAILSMPKVTKQDFILQMTKENPKIFELFDAHAYTSIINSRKEKEDMIKAANVIETEHLVKMMEELPKDLTAVVLTQIDTRKFADVLLANFKNILSEIVAA